MNKYKINIRKIQKEDLRAVAEIGVNGWKTAYRGIIDDEYLDNLSIEENYQKTLKNYTENGFIVAELNNEVVGFCRYRTGNYYKNEYANIDCEISALYVKTEYKGNGIGKKLVNYVINQFKQNGFTKMIIWCLKENYSSRAFYEKMGGIYCGENIIERGNKQYKEAGYIYDLKKLPKDELELVFLAKEHKKQVEEYLQEFLDNGEKEIAGDGGLDRIKDFDKWLEKIQNDLSINTINKDRVSATLYLTVRKSDKKIVGNLQIRHFLNDKLLKDSGHIGDSVRPSERRKGYATEQIRLALEKCKELGIDNVLITCDKTNIGSAKSIQNNGGILENEIYVENIFKLFEENGGECYIVELEADINERVLRNKTENRLQNKPTKRNIEWSEQELLNSVNKYRLNSEEGEITHKNYLRINNTNLSAKDVAKMIKDKFEL